MRCANMKWIQQVLLKIQSGHDSVHRRTDVQTDKVKPVYPPFNFVEAGSIINSEFDKDIINQTGTWWCIDAIFVKQYDTT